MAINVTVLNESSSGTGSISLDFVFDILASAEDFPISTENQFYFRLTTNSTQVGGGSIPVKVMQSLSDLALNSAKQSRADDASAYSSVTDMMEDYIFDFIHGHTDDQYSSGVSAQGAMNI
jgi:hypothetical protein